MNELELVVPISSDSDRVTPIFIQSFSRALHHLPISIVMSPRGVVTKLKRERRRRRRCCITVHYRARTLISAWSIKKATASRRDAEWIIGSQTTDESLPHHHAVSFMLCW